MNASRATSRELQGAVVEAVGGGLSVSASGGTSETVIHSSRHSDSLKIFSLPASSKIDAVKAIYFFPALFNHSSTLPHPS